MAKIQIDIDEINYLNNRIEELEKEIVKKDKELEKLRDSKDNLNDAIDYTINYVTKLDRWFRWKKILKNIKDLANGNP